MESLHIKYQPKVKEKILAFLNSFSEQEVKIIKEDQAVLVVNEEFEKYKLSLHREVEKIKSGESKIYDIDELDAMLEKTISKYEG
jgi:hypothetical protein